MPTTTSYGGYAVPVTTDTDAVPVDLKAYGNQVEPWTIRRFANAGERTAVLASAVAAGLAVPVRGMVTWLDSPGRLEFYNGTSWLPLIPAKESYPTAWAGATWDGVSTLDRREYTAIVTVGNSAGGWSHNWSGGAFPNGVVFVGAAVADVVTGSLPVVNSVLPIFASATLTGISGVATQTDGNVYPIGNNIRVAIRVVGW